jgi:hypothetical protein
VERSVNMRDLDGIGTGLESQFVCALHTNTADTGKNVDTCGDHKRSPVARAVLVVAVEFLQYIRRPNGILCQICIQLLHSANLAALLQIFVTSCTSMNTKAQKLLGSSYTEEISSMKSVSKNCKLWFHRKMLLF